MIKLKGEYEQQKKKGTEECGDKGRRKICVKALGSTPHKNFSCVTHMLTYVKTVITKKYNFFFFLSTDKFLHALTTEVYDPYVHWGQSSSRK